MLDFFFKNNKQASDTKSNINISQFPKILPLSSKASNNTDYLEEMSLIKGQYLEYLVLKTGELVGALSSTGINMDLLNKFEQERVFDDYSAFLNAYFSGDDPEDHIQIIDSTVPVDIHPYLLAWKKRYLEAADNEDEELKQLCASYVLHFEEQERLTEMTTKSHLFVVKEKIRANTLESLHLARRNLDEKMQDLRNSLEETFQQYEVEIKKLNAHEYKEFLYHFTNFSRE